eukprot:TRINITY_DN32433_c0_g1_i1.p1 TRINITY_DN32433_c0_g1~~TRINITY_DN32433_c0_g1_i1.p1  ORF type:complete len:305 (+),score=24.49 TRINITY_DN32433_c0_g1_i1:59-916(+)
MRVAVSNISHNFLAFSYSKPILASLRKASLGDQKKWRIFSAKGAGVRHAGRARGVHGTRIAASERPTDKGTGPFDSLDNMSRPSEFRIVKEDVVYSRFIKVYNRVVEYPAGSSGKSVEERTVEYDVVASKARDSHFVAVLPFHSATKTFTLLSEYAQGANENVYGVPCGGYSAKHASLEECATRELSEEAFLKGGRLIRLLPESHPGLLEVKWCKNRFTPFLVIDPEPDLTPFPRDAEELSLHVDNVDLPTLRQRMYDGSMMLPSIVTCAMALDYLQSKEGLVLP